MLTFFFSLLLALQVLRSSGDGASKAGMWTPAAPASWLALSPSNVHSAWGAMPSDAQAAARRPARRGRPEAPAPGACASRGSPSASCSPSEKGPDADAPPATLAALLIVKNEQSGIERTLRSLMCGGERVTGELAGDHGRRARGG